MNKRQLKKLIKKQEVTKEDAQKAWNIVVRYLNKRPEISFSLDSWDKNYDSRRYTINSIEQKEILIADTGWDKYSDYKMGYIQK